MFVAPVAVEKVLNGHTSQVSWFDAPIAVLYLPATQGVQEDEAASEYSPVPQKAQVDSLVAAVDKLNFPAAQSEQDAPVDELNFPAVQSEQVVASLTLLDFPSAQASQSELKSPPVGL